MLLLTLARVATVLIFLTTAVGGPYAILLLRRFIAAHTLAHGILMAELEALRRRVTHLDERV